MSHLGTNASPGRSYISVGKFNQIQSILDELLPLRTSYCHHFLRLILAGKSHVHNRNCFCTNLLTQQEIFIISQSQRLVVMTVWTTPVVLLVIAMYRPAIPVIISFPNWFQRILITIAIIQSIAFYNTATWKTQKSRF